MKCDTQNQPVQGCGGLAPQSVFCQEVGHRKERRGAKQVRSSLASSLQVCLLMLLATKEFSHCTDSVRTSVGIVPVHHQCGLPLKAPILLTSCSKLLQTAPWVLTLAIQQSHLENTRFQKCQQTMSEGVTCALVLCTRACQHFDQTALFHKRVSNGEQIFVKVSVDSGEPCVEDL